MAFPPDAGTFQIRDSPDRRKYTHRPSLEKLGTWSFARSEVRRRALRSRNHIDSQLALDVGVERNQLAVIGPVRVGSELGVQGRELKGVGPIRIGHPDFQRARAIRLKSDAAAIGRKLRQTIPSC